MYLYMMGGRRSYEGLQGNLRLGLPSVSTVVAGVRKVNEPTVEGQVRTKELKQFLLEREYGNAVFVSEDATRIVDRVEFDSRANRCVGFVGPLNRNGLPELTIFTADTAEAIARHFKEYPAAKFAYVVMAQPLYKNAPAFCLCIFGTDNRFTTQDVLNRWHYIKIKAKEDSIVVVGFASDGGKYRCEQVAYAGLCGCAGIERCKPLRRGLRVLRGIVTSRAPAGASIGNPLA